MKPGTYKDYFLFNSMILLRIQRSFSGRWERQGKQLSYFGYEYVYGPSGHPDKYLHTFRLGPYLIMLGGFK